MNVSKELLAEIVARSSTFDERLRNGYLVADPARDEKEIDRRLERWRDLATKGDSRLFEEVLALRGLDHESVRRGLGRVKLADPDRIPEWTGLLAECLAAAKTIGGTEPGTPRFCNEVEPLPFEQILTPFVETAAHHLRKQAGKAFARLQEKAQIALERLLLSWLVGPCGAALMLEFSLFRLRARPERDAAGTSNGNSSELYSRFAHELLGGELQNFLSEYNVLARAIATIINHWVSAMSEFLERLDADWDQLPQVFLSGHENGAVVDIKAGLSDPHHGGRTVLALKFGSGLKVVYKPKSLDTEVAFGHVLDWVNENGADLPLRSPRVLARPGYGWVEYLEHIACEGDDQLVRFYRRSGMLLALFYVLDTTDVHAENLMAVSEFPMLVDAETLITTQFRSADSEGQQSPSEVLAMRHLNDSVLKTAMLPAWPRDWDLSALGGVGGEEIEAPVWIGAHTDSMERQVSKMALRRNQNIPFPSDRVPEPGRFVEDIVAGFESVYRILIDNREVLLAPDSPLTLLARAPMRLIFRETQTYFNILKKSFDPAVLRDGADRSVDLEVLSRILFVSGSRAKYLPLVEVEKRSLESLDIPAFTTFPANCSLHAGPERIADDYFSECSYLRVLANLRNLSVEGCAKQCEIIRGSFYAKILNQRAAANRRNNAGDELLTAAVKIGKLLKAKAIRGEDGSASWIGLVYKPELAAYRYLPLATDLLDGQPGVALFLAALSKVTGDESVRKLADGAILPLRRSIRAALDDGGWKKAKDGKMESASLIYSLIRAAELLDDDSLVELAREAAGLVTVELFQRKPCSDLPNCSSEILRGLFALWSVTKDDTLLTRATFCRDHLLGGADRAETEPQAQANGFDMLKNSTRQANKKWLPGLLGAGLELLQQKEAITADYKCKWLEASLRQFCESELMPLDSVAEGNFAIVELAVEASERFSCLDPLDNARRLAAKAAKRAEDSGAYTLCTGIPVSAPCFGYLHGVAGIGYTLLRTYAPELRSILLWN